MSVSEQDELLLNTYLDGELAPIEAGRFQQRLAEEPGLAVQAEARLTLRDRLRSDLDEDLPSDDLRRRIMASVGGPPERKTRPWGSLAASFLAGAVLAGALSFGALNEQGRNDVASEIVSAHIRALMAPQSIDVPSSDRHTVKPWFAGKLAFAPKVVDLATQGFPLVGARIRRHRAGAGRFPRLLEREAYDQRDGNAEHAATRNTAREAWRKRIRRSFLERWQGHVLGGFRRGS